MKQIFSDSFNNSIASKAFRDVLEQGCTHGVFLRQKNMFSIAIPDNNEVVEMIPLPSENNQTKLKSAVEVGRITQNGIRLEWKWSLDFHSDNPANPFDVMASIYYKQPRVIKDLLLEEQIYIEMLFKIGFLLSNGREKFKDAAASGAFYANDELVLPKAIDIHVFKIGSTAMDRLSTAVQIAKSCLNKVLAETTNNEGKLEYVSMLSDEIEKQLEQAIHLLDLQKDDLLELNKLDILIYKDN